MKKVLFFLIVLFIPVVLYASPFVVSDPYPASATQPDGFKGTLNGVAFDVPYTTDGGGLRYFKLDLAGKWVVGTNSLVVKAYNVWAESATVPFDFGAGSPVLPQNVRVIK